MHRKANAVDLLPFEDEIKLKGPMRAGAAPPSSLQARSVARSSWGIADCQRHGQKDPKGYDRATHNEADGGRYVGLFLLGMDDLCKRIRSVEGPGVCHFLCQVDSPRAACRVRPTGNRSRQ